MQYGETGIRFSGSVRVTRVSANEITVRAANGSRPVPDAAVALVDGSGGVVAALTTGADGEYVFAEVPPGRYFMLGDHRDLSQDSRYFGFVAADQVIGKVVAVFPSRPDPR